ncbi:membrane protein [Mycolicibacterium cyprinidarum]|uniref:Membrane protein n=1 Tax=Mycolicibacterium cyprinidarum TaxID=2860311 RepID=A0ABQ4V7W5_9MYCO|nr:membrane protein [Mycolicibacterium sp. NGTWSNA01]GJF14731.1 membrane protein [Mycolicibacterium sp. NGTWS0302]
MKLLGRNKDDSEGSRDDDHIAPAEPTDATPAGSSGQRVTTAPKGKPTPKRSEASRKRGPVAPAPLTSAEARQRRKKLGGPKLSREEKKAQRSQRRSEMSSRRERMMAGEAAYLLPRDQGPARRYVRDVVDSRRNLLGMFMPSALGLVFIMLAVPSIQVQQLLSPAMLLLVVVMVVDGFVLGRKVNRLVDEKFPDNTESGWKLGFYAASRASQLRRMRAPRPQVERGADVVSHRR